MITVSDFSFVLSGGFDNRDPQSSLGGIPSVQPIVGTLNNLFSNIPQATADSGGNDYRCFYIFNDSPTDVLYDSKIFILSEITGGSYVELGFLKQYDVQQISIIGIPTVGGSAVFTYENHDISATWNGTVSDFAGQIKTALNSILGENVVSWEDQSDEKISFNLTFQKYRWQPPLVLKSNTTAALITIGKLRNGSPVNATTVIIDNPSTPPGFVSFSYPTAQDPLYIGDLYPSDGFPVWVKRITDPFTTPLSLDGFTVRLTGSPAGVTEIPPVVIDQADFTYVATGGVSTSGLAVVQSNNYVYAGAGDIIISGEPVVTSSVPPSTPLPCNICCYSGTLPEIYIVNLSSVDNIDVATCNCGDLQGGIAIIYDPVSCVWMSKKSNYNKVSYVLWYEFGDATWRLSGGADGCSSVYARWKAEDWKCCGRNTLATAQTIGGTNLQLFGCNKNGSTSLTVTPGCCFSVDTQGNCVGYSEYSGFNSYCGSAPCDSTKGLNCPEVVGGGVIVSGFSEYNNRCADCGTNYPPANHPEWQAMNWEGFAGFPGDGNGVSATSGSTFPIFFGIWNNHVPGTAKCSGSIDIVIDAAASTGVYGVDYTINPNPVQHYEFGCGARQFNTGIAIFANSSGKHVVFKFINPVGVSIGTDHPTFRVSW